MKPIRCMPGSCGPGFTGCERDVIAHDALSNDGLDASRGERHEWWQ